LTILTIQAISYLRGKLQPVKDGSKQRVAIVVKPCDSKSINVLLSENCFERQQVYIIGVGCDGIQEGAGFGKTDGDFQRRCLTCRERTPVIYDVLVGEPPRIEDTSQIISPSLLATTAFVFVPPPSIPIKYFILSPFKYSDKKILNFYSTNIRIYFAINGLCQKSSIYDFCHTEDPPAHLHRVLQNKVFGHSEERSEEESTPSKLKIDSSPTKVGFRMTGLVSFLCYLQQPGK